jgi:ABC-type antimicrobial peptide transport system permease subunit
MDRDQAVFFSGDLQQYLDDSLAQRRFTVFLLVAFGLFALLLACIGIYAVFSYSVSQRTAEFGIRMAVGATPAQIGRAVFRDAAILCLAGIAIGIAATFGLTRLLASLLYGISETDPTVFLSVPLGLLGVALLASYLPMRRAMKVEPMHALRYE